jgi:hypothetical protein
MRGRRLILGLVLAGAIALVAGEAFAQRGLGRYQGRIAEPADYDGSFHFCRGWFRNALNGDGGGGSWQADWPYADINLSIRLAELTKTTVSKDSAGDPQPMVVRLSDPMLHQCGFVMMTEVGSIALDQAEIDNLRTYLQKGGFLWVDDFWGSYAWRFWENAIRKVFPAADYPITELTADHPMMNTQFQIKEVAQITNIGWWRGTGTTSERGADSPRANARIISDKNGRVMVLMTHNTDFGDAWEREGEDASFFYKFAADGYAFGINVVLYSMMH